MKIFAIVAASAVVLTACTAQVPDSGQGVGFNDFAEFELERARREAQLRGETGPVVAANGAIVTPGAPTPTSVGGGVNSSDLAAAGIGSQSGAGISTGPTAGSPTGPNVGQTVGPAVGTQGAPATAAQTRLASNADISDEQDFGAVASRESIESDAERRARQAAAYQLIEATALPDRNGNAGPNIVQYALQAPNNLGERVFDRSGFNAANRFARNCAKYRSPDEAQRDFINRGGPQRDRLGLDPDGDGFACGWDPQAFRTLASGN